MTRIGSTVCLKIYVAGASMMIRLVIMSMDAMTYLLRHFSGLLTAAVLLKTMASDSC